MTGAPGRASRRPDPSALRARSAIADVVLVAVLLGLSIAGIIRPADVDVGVQLNGETGIGPALFALAVVEAVPLLVRRRWPGAVLLVVAAAMGVRVLFGLHAVAADFALFVALFAVGRYAVTPGQWAAAAGYAVHPALLLLFPATRSGASVATVVLYLLTFLIVPVSAGWAARRLGRPSHPAASAEIDRDASESPPAAEACTATAPAIPPPTEPVTAAVRVELTAREREILLLVSEGLSNSQIGERVHLSPETVKTYVSRVIAKLGVRDRTQAALAADRLGLLGPSRPPPSG